VKTDHAHSVWDIRLPEPDAPLFRSHLRQPPTWQQFLRETQEPWARYMREHDSPEERLAAKHPARFVLS
jgi:hypothetical protein